MVQEVLTGGVSVSAQDTNNNKTGLYFDVVMEHSVSIQNQITDNYLENNTAIQDHIAKSPIVVSLRGLSGELVFTPPSKALTFLYDTVNAPLKTRFTNNRVATDKLTVIPALLPPVDNITQLAKNAVQYVEASVERYVKIVKNFTSQLQRQTRLKQIYNDLMALREANTLMVVETPYDIFFDMAIQSITLRQGNQNYITDIELTLKQINYAEVKTTKADSAVLAKYNEVARAEVENCGKAQGVDANNSLLYNTFGNGKPYATYNQ